MNEETKKKRQNLFLIFIFFALIALNIVPSIISLSGMGSESYNVIAAEKLTVIDNSIGGLIPIGKEYYYMGYTKDGQLILIREKKDWLEEKFNGYEFDSSESGIMVKGQSKYTSANVLYIAEQYVEDVRKNSEAGSMINNVMYYNYLDGLSFRYDVMGIIAGILLFSMGITGFVLYKKHRVPKNMYVRYACFIFVIIFLFFELHIITLRFG